MTPGKRFRAIIADDEALLAGALASELKSIWPDLDLIAIEHDGEAALERILQESPDIVFLDIQMPGLTGLEVAQAIAEEWPAGTPPLIVFVTAYDEFAIEAFDLAAIDYVTKPVRTDRLTRTVKRLQKRLASADEKPLDTLASQLQSLLAARPTAPPLQWIRAGVGDSVRMISIDDVVYFEAADKYVLVATASGDSLIRESLRSLLPQLDPQQFVQIHRSRVVNMRRVELAERGDDGKLRLQLGGRAERPVVSRVFVHLFRPM